MNLKLETLDGRHSGNQLFKYRVWVFGENKIPDFNEVRNWCWEVWGPSCERDNHILIKYRHPDTERNSHWAWYQKDRNHYIYLTNDQALAFFKLKWM